MVPAGEETPQVDYSILRCDVSREKINKRINTHSADVSSTDDDLYSNA